MENSSEQNPEQKTSITNQENENLKGEDKKENIIEVKNEENQENKNEEIKELKEKNDESSTQEEEDKKQNDESNVEKKEEKENGKKLEQKEGANDESNNENKTIQKNENENGKEEKDKINENISTNEKTENIEEKKDIELKDDKSEVLKKNDENSKERDHTKEVKEDIKEEIKEGVGEGEGKKIEKNGEIKELTEVKKEGEKLEVKDEIKEIKGEKKEGEKEETKKVKEEKKEDIKENIKVGQKEDKKEEQKNVQKEDKKGGKKEDKQENKEVKIDGKNGEIKDDIKTDEKKKTDISQEKKEEQNKIAEKVKENPMEAYKNKILSDLTSKYGDKISEYNKTNYKKFYEKFHFCDYYIGKEWKAGFIIDITKNDYLEISQATSENNTNLSISKIKINDSRNLAYFRKNSKPDKYMVKGPEKNLHNKLALFTNFHKNFKQFMENSDNYEFYYFLRTTIYYGLDFCMNPNIKSDKVEISFGIILMILNIICDCLNYIESNLKEFLLFQDDIKFSQLKDCVLLDKKYSIFSFFDDINILIKKIFGDSSEYLDWYIKFRDNINMFNPAVNDNPKTSNISKILLLYKDQKGGIKDLKLMKKTCLPEVYNKQHMFHTLNKSISSCIIAYFVDYFNFIGGYEKLFNILCSIYHFNETSKSKMKVQYSLIEDLNTAKIITDSFAIENQKEIEKVNKYVNSYFDNNIEENIDSADQKELSNLFIKLFDLTQKNKEKRTIALEGIYIRQKFKELTCSKKLEKNIALLSEVNNIIKSVKYNKLYKEIKEGNNPDYVEEMLNDKQFDGRDKSISKMTEEYFCNLCQENKIIKLFLDDKTTTHEEVIKRLFDLLLIMYSNNFGYPKQEDKKEVKIPQNKKKETPGNTKGDTPKEGCNETLQGIKEEKIDEIYVFNTLFKKLKESEQNNESLWKIILLDIILKFSEQLKEKDKYYVFDLIKEYFENSTTKKNSKIIQMFSFINNYSIKCIEYSKNDKNETASVGEDFIYYNNKKDYEGIIKGNFNEKKFYGFGILINHMVEKNKLNELQVNEELKKNVINTINDGIIEIVKKFKSDNNIIKILLIKILSSIISSNNVIQNIKLLERILSICEKKNIKQSLEGFFKENNVSKSLMNESIQYIKSIKEFNGKEENNIKMEIQKRLDLIFLLLENEINYSKDDFLLFFFEMTNSNIFIKKIFYEKMKKNILKIKEEILLDIFNNKLVYKEAPKPIPTPNKRNDKDISSLIKECSSELNTNNINDIKDLIVGCSTENNLSDIQSRNISIINNINRLFYMDDQMNYELLKEYILQTNSSKNIFKIINKNNIIVLIRDNCKEIFQYDKLIEILTKTTNKDIRNDVSSLLASIYLGIKFSSINNYKKVWDSILKEIIDNFKKATDNNIDNNAVKGLICVVKKIVDESSKDGDIILDKTLVENLFKPLKNKKEQLNKDKDKDKDKDKNEIFPLKICLEYYDDSNEKNSIGNKVSNICDIYEDELFYHLRYYISNKFKIPLNCIQIQNSKIQNTTNDANNNNIQDGKNLLPTKNSKIPQYTLLHDSINIIKTFPELLQTIKKKNKKDETYQTIIINKIENPLNDSEIPNLKNLITSNKELQTILQNLLKVKNNDYGTEIWGILNDKNSLNKDKEEEMNVLIESLILNDNKDSQKKEESFKELFSFDDSNIFFMSMVLSLIYKFLTKNDDNKQKENITKFINSIIWENKIKNLSTKSSSDGDGKKLSIKELYEQKSYENNLLKIYKIIMNSISDNNQKLDFIILKIFDIYCSFINDTVNINIANMNTSLKNKEEIDFKEKINIIFNETFEEVIDLFKNNKYALIMLINLLLNKENSENNLKQQFEICFIEGIIKNNFPNYAKKISELLKCLIQNEYYKEKEAINIQSNFYKYISSIFFTKNSYEKMTQLILELINNKNIFVVLYTKKYILNLKLYQNMISEILLFIYEYVNAEFDFNNYINEIVIPYLYEPKLNNVKEDDELHEIFFRGHCQMLCNYIIKANYENYELIKNYKGNNLKEYLFNDIIMNGISKDKNSNKNYVNKNPVRNKNSLSEAANLFICMLAKEIANDQNNESNAYNNAISYLEKLNKFHQLGYWKKTTCQEISDWKLYFGENNSSNAFVGLKNLGCTCYMNSLLQVFYHIELFRESLLRCNCPEEKKNSLYEVKKVFLWLKYLKTGYYEARSFVDNYDNEKLDVHQQMDVDEFFSNILDKLENRLKNTQNDNLIKYFFQGKLNDTLSFREGCTHDRTNVNSFYSIQLQVQNKRNVYESLDTLTESELMNGDNCIFCPKCDKKFPALKSQCFGVLPRILMFVLKRFEFNFDTMTKFKINDYYEFPLELDMNKYTSEFIYKKNTQQNNKYKLKSVVVHMGHSEGGHYYAYIQDKKSNNWYQFNDTSVTKFDIKDLNKETFGGKEDDGSDKIRSAYLLFYEKIDQSNCENFDNNKELNSLINKNNISNETKTNDNNDGFSILDKEENTIEQKDSSSGEKNDVLDTIIKRINEESERDNLNQKLFSNEYHQFTLGLFLNLLNVLDYNNNTLHVFLQTLSNLNIFEYNYQTELYLIRNLRPKGSNINKYLDKGKLKIFDINQNDLKDVQKVDNTQKITELFKYILIQFFNIIIRSREKKYFGCYVDLIKFFVDKYDFCANYLLEEFLNFNVIVEYLINCPLDEIKKVIVEILSYAINSSIISFKTSKIKTNNKTEKDKKDVNNDKNEEKNNKDSKGNNNKDDKDNQNKIILEENKNENILKDGKNDESSSQKEKNDNNEQNTEKKDNQERPQIPQTEQGGHNIHYSEETNSSRGQKEDNNNKTQQKSDEELARELNEQLNGPRRNNDDGKKEDEKMLENNNISPTVIKLYYNILCVIREVRFRNLRDSQFLYKLLLKFSLISKETRQFKLKKINVVLLLNMLSYQGLKQKSHPDDTIITFESSMFKSSHEILNCLHEDHIRIEGDTKNRNKNSHYDFLLLCHLISFKEKSKEEIAKIESRDIGFSFWNGEYILQLIDSVKTKQDINYLSNAIIIKCINSEKIFDNVLNVLVDILERVNDCEDSFYDESDEENNFDIYSNMKNNNTNRLILFRSNVTMIFKKLAMETNDKIDESKIKSCINKLYSFFKDNRKYYGMSIVIINIIVDIIDIRKLQKEYNKQLTDILGWLNKFSTPPKYTEQKGISMYRNESNSYYQSAIGNDFLGEFNTVELKKTSKKIARIENLLNNKNTQIDISSIYYDLSDFKFAIGDQVIYNNKNYEVTDYLDELIKIKLIEDTGKEKNKNKTIYEKEKSSFWIETDHYKLRIKKLVPNNLNITN